MMGVVFIWKERCLAFLLDLPLTCYRSSASYFASLYCSACPTRPAVTLEKICLLAGCVPPCDLSSIRDPMALL